MAHLKEIKNRIASVSSTQQITKAMKLVSAAKLRKAQQRMFSMRDFFESLSALTNRVCSEKKHPYMAPVRQGAPSLCLLVSADRGLCGAFNSNVFKRLLEHIQSQSNSFILPIGKRAAEFARRQFPQERVVEGHEEALSALSYRRAEALAKEVTTLHSERALGQVRVIYNAFKNVMTQVVRSEVLLPITPVPPDRSGHDYVYESGVVPTVAELLPYFLKNRLFLMLLESQAAEHAARMTSMDKATENTEELIRTLKVSYNRTRQTAITTELLEIIAGADALTK